MDILNIKIGNCKYVQQITPNAIDGKKHTVLVSRMDCPKNLSGSAILQKFDTKKEADLFIKSKLDEASKGAPIEIIPNIFNVER